MISKMAVWSLIAVHVISVSLHAESDSDVALFQFEGGGVQFGPSGGSSQDSSDSSRRSYSDDDSDNGFHIDINTAPVRRERQYTEERQDYREMPPQPIEAPSQPVMHTKQVPARTYIYQGNAIDIELEKTTYYGGQTQQKLKLYNKGEEPLHPKICVRWLSGKQMGEIFSPGISQPIPPDQSIDLFLPFGNDEFEIKVSEDGSKDPCDDFFPKKEPKSTPAAKPKKEPPPKRTPQKPKPQLVPMNIHLAANPL